MKRWYTIAAVFALAVCSLGDDCNPESSQPEFPKINGWVPGNIRLCVLGEGIVNDTAVAVYRFDPGGQNTDATLKKGDKGYCTYIKVPWKNQSHHLTMDIWSKFDSVKFTEVGIYAVAEDKKNPPESAFAYVKAIKDNDDWWVSVNVKSSVPAIDVFSP
jgi:hypothetical protein